MGVTLVVVTRRSARRRRGLRRVGVAGRRHRPPGPIERHPRVRRFLRERFDRETRRGFLLTAAFGILVRRRPRRRRCSSTWSTPAPGSPSSTTRSPSGAPTHASSTTVDVLQVITDLGGTPVVMVALATTGVVAYRRTHNVEILVLLAAVGIGQLVLVNLIKVIVDRDRPNVLQLVTVHGPSFPSGHSAAAAACWAAVAFVLGHDAPRLARALLAAVGGGHGGRGGEQPGPARRALADRHPRRPGGRVGLVRPRAAGVQDAGAHSRSAPGRTLNDSFFVVPLQPPSSS